MNSIDNIIKLFPNNSFSREDIFYYTRNMDTSFKKTQLRYLIGKLLKNKLIVRNGHNSYIKNNKNKKDYINIYSFFSKEIISFMNKNFPLVDYRLWELFCLNDFVNHQISKNKIFFEIEKDCCEFMYNEMPEKFRRKILLNPTPEEVMLYGDEKNIIITKLTTETPKGQKNFYGLCLEKLIVDLFSNKILQSILSKGDYPAAVSEMFNKYNINQNKMLRYAARKNKKNEILKFLKYKTNMVILRDFYLNKLIKHKNNGFIKIVSLKNIY